MNTVFWLARTIKYCLLIGSGLHLGNIVSLQRHHLKLLVPHHRNDHQGNVVFWLVNPSEYCVPIGQSYPFFWLVSTSEYCLLIGQSIRHQSTVSLAAGYVTLLFQICYCTVSVSILVIEEIMKLYSSSSSSELKNLSTIIIELMVSGVWN